jgi:hypothetical protein
MLKISLNTCALQKSQPSPMTVLICPRESHNVAVIAYNIKNQFPTNANNVRNIKNQLPTNTDKAVSSSHRDSRWISGEEMCHLYY